MNFFDRIFGIKGNLTKVNSVVETKGGLPVTARPKTAQQGEKRKRVKKPMQNRCNCACMSQPRQTTNPVRKVRTNTAQKAPAKTMAVRPVKALPTTAHVRKVVARPAMAPVKTMAVRPVKAQSTTAQVRKVAARPAKAPVKTMAVRPVKARPTASQKRKKIAKSFAKNALRMAVMPFPFPKKFPKLPRFLRRKRRKKK